MFTRVMLERGKHKFILTYLFFRNPFYFYFESLQSIPEAGFFLPLASLENKVRGPRILFCIKNLQKYGISCWNMTLVMKPSTLKNGVWRIMLGGFLFRFYA